MKTQTGLGCFVVAALAVMVFGTGRESHATPANQESEKQFPPLIRSVEGPDLFRAYCASCHGKDAKGNGPAAPSLKATVPDLTMIPRNEKGDFPAERVRRIIQGEGMLASHGSREMPIWGPIFHQVESDVDWGNVRLENLVKYLESIQAIRATQEDQGGKSSAKDVPSGEHLFQQLCASCHGSDLKGNGPAPYPFNDFPPDLTKLAKRHGGIFPAEYVANVLRNGVVLKAHGPPEMPTWGLDFKEGYHLNEAQVTQRIKNLSDYIKSQQAQ
jgi:mono/diheme cytochrome c family protein